MNMRLFSVMLGIGAFSLSTLALRVSAQEPAAPATASAASGSVGAALAKLKTFNATPATDAKYYIYLESASWCSPCRKEMPKIVKAYDEMKANGVEVILVARDTTAEAAQKYLSTFKASFPGVFNVADDFLPGFTSADYYPHAVIVDAQGNVVADDNGSIVLEWKSRIKAHEDRQQ